MQPVVNITDYHKLSDILYWFGQRVVLKMNVILSSSNSRTGERSFFHSETQYRTKDGTEVRSINRNIQFFLTIEKYETGNYSSIMIRITDMYILQNILETVRMWIDGPSKVNAFLRTKDGQFHVKNPTPKTCLDGLAENKYILFEPVVVQFDESSDTTIGVRLTLGSPDNYIDISADKFYGFYYLITKTDMYNAALNMINYLGHPVLGQLSKDISVYRHGMSQQELESTVSGGNNNRQIKKKQVTSFFDKMNILDD